MANKSIPLLALVVFYLLTAPVLGATFSAPVLSVINNENDPAVRERLIKEMERIDYLYGDLYNKMRGGRKITVFVDPAHGMLDSGVWQGSVTWRQSTTGEPEELYSIPIARALYSNVMQNSSMRIATTHDFLNVLKGNSIIYNDIGFSESARLADRADSFLMVSCHLNNISPIYKADGYVNLYGIHITCDNNGTRYLSDVKNVQRGFLTLHSAFDPSGFSRNIAVDLRSNHSSQNMYINEWDEGVVADDRYSYFWGYPMAVIFETGFISNPDEEQFLRIPANQKMIGKAQYNSIISSIRNTFGVDISSGTPVKIFDQPQHLTDVIMLSRAIVYYMKTGASREAQFAAKTLIDNYDQGQYYEGVQFYKALHRRLATANALAAKAEGAKKKKLSRKTIRSYYARASRSAGKGSFYRAVRRSISGGGLTDEDLGGESPSSTAQRIGAPPKFAALPVSVEKHTLSTPFILAIKPGNTLKEAIDQSIAPGEKNKAALYKSLTNAKMTKSTWVKVYSQKKKRYVWKKKIYKIQQDFPTGIYIVRITAKMGISSIEKVSRVAFDPKRYQNQEYFKNSCLAEEQPAKSL